MRFAHRKLSQSQSSARVSVALSRVAKPITWPTGFELRFLSRCEKRGRSRLASGVAIHPLAQLGSISCTPCLAREEISIRHETLFLECALPLEELDLNPASSRLHRPSAAGSSARVPSIGSDEVTVATPSSGGALTRGDTRVFSIVRMLFFSFTRMERRRKKT